MDVARMLYEKQNGVEESDNNALPKEDTDKFTAKAEIPQENTAEGTAEGIVASKTADETDEMNNEVIDSDRYNMKDSTEMNLGQVFSYTTSDDLGVEIATDYTEDYYNADEIVLDPDNFEYFKGVSSNSSETNFVNR